MTQDVPGAVERFHCLVVPSQSVEEALVSARYLVIDVRPHQALAGQWLVTQATIALLPIYDDRDWYGQTGTLQPEQRRNNHEMLRRFKAGQLASLPVAHSLHPVAQAKLNKGFLCHEEAALVMSAGMVTAQELAVVEAHHNCGKRCKQELVSESGLIAISGLPTEPNPLYAPSETVVDVRPHDRS